MSCPLSPGFEIAAHVANINLAAKDLRDSEWGASFAARRRLQVEAKKLLSALEEPSTEV